MKIIVDAMGGDNAPQEIVKGAVRARRELGVDIELVGRKEEVERCLAAEADAEAGEDGLQKYAECFLHSYNPPFCERHRRGYETP